MEVWKDIPGYEGLYQASSEGRIRSVEGKRTFTEWHGQRCWKSRIMKGRGKSNSGYRVSLWKDGKRSEHLVARLVCETFYGSPKDGDTVNHKDGNRFNNNIDNLEWLSLADNIRYGFANGQYPSTHIAIYNEKESFEFRSMASCDRFLQRFDGYTKQEMRKGRLQLKAKDGTDYSVKNVYYGRF